MCYMVKGHQSNKPLEALLLDEMVGRELAVKPIIGSTPLAGEIAPGRELVGVAEGELVLSAWEGWPKEWGA